MRLPVFASAAAPLLFAAAITVAAVAAVVSPANAAQASRLSDAAYLDLGRCAGVAEGARIDAAAYSAALNAAQVGRVPAVLDQADAVRETARNNTAKTSGVFRQQAVADMTATCQPYITTTIAGR